MEVLMEVLTKAKEFFQLYPFILNIILPASLAAYLFMKFYKSQVRKGEFKDSFGITTPHTEAERAEAQKRVDEVITKQTLKVKGLYCDPELEKEANKEAGKLRRTRHSAVMQRLDVDGSLKRHLTKDR